MNNIAKRAVLSSITSIVGFNPFASFPIYSHYEDKKRKCSNPACNKEHSFENKSYCSAECHKQHFGAMKEATKNSPQ